MNLIQRAVSQGGKLAPLVIPEGASSGLMNPSIFIDDVGDILVNLRHINYTLYHAENTQKFPTIWGPLAYLHPESDLTLRTTNYICKLNDDLEITNYAKVDTSELDVNPLWEFHGEEDCRLVQWRGEYFLIGVRRDTTTHGQGRMEYSKINLNKKDWTAKEVHRLRIPAPAPDESYCEKNWMPILDKPYHFVKWTMPTEVVNTHPYNKTSETVIIKQTPSITHDQRGGSQVIRWGSMYITFTHEVDLFKNYLEQKDAFYRHRMIVWDEQFNFVGASNPFTFLDARVEFCVGAANYKGDLLITFGFQDNAAFVLRLPKVVVEDLLLEALSYAAV
jgi:hypothetical protein